MEYFIIIQIIKFEKNIAKTDELPVLNHRRFSLGHPVFDLQLPNYKCNLCDCNRSHCRIRLQQKKYKKPTTCDKGLGQLAYTRIVWSIISYRTTKQHTHTHKMYQPFVRRPLRARSPLPVCRSPNMFSLALPSNCQFPRKTQRCNIVNASNTQKRAE